jgi:hypothetical protein
VNTRDFCFWLQGFFEVHGTSNKDYALSPEQVDVIKKHLDMVFVHDIDPSMGGPEKQQVLNEIHEKPYFKMTANELDKKYGVGVRPRC